MITSRPTVCLSMISRLVRADPGSPRHRAGSRAGADPGLAHGTALECSARRASRIHAAGSGFCCICVRAGLRDRTCRLFVTVGRRHARYRADSTEQCWSCTAPTGTSRNPMITSVAADARGEARVLPVLGAGRLAAASSSPTRSTCRSARRRRWSALRRSVPGRTEPMCRAGFRGFGRGTSRSRSQAFEFAIEPGLCQHDGRPIGASGMTNTARRGHWSAGLSTHVWRSNSMAHQRIPCCRRGGRVAQIGGISSWPPMPRRRCAVRRRRDGSA